MIQQFIDAVKALFDKKVLPSEMSSRDWQAVAPAIRQRAFFSATVANAGVLTRFRSMLLDWQSGAVEQVTSPTGAQSVAYKTGNLADFRLKSREFLVNEGLATPDDFQNDSMRNIAGASRLKLIFNTNIEQAQTFANWQRIVNDPLLINEFPVARFVRRPGAIVKRPRHVAAEGEIRRLDDFAYWLFQNAPDIGGFSVPWGPYGFNSYMVQEFISRKEAIRLGVIVDGQRISPPNVTMFGVKPAQAIMSGVKAEMKDVPDDIALQARQRLVDRLGPQVLRPDGSVSLDFLRNKIAR